MLGLDLPGSDRPLRVLCLGAHSDDIEIGAGATLLAMQAAGRRLEVRWCVLSGSAERAAEAQRSANDFLAAVASRQIECAAFRDGYFPYLGGALKDWFAGLQRSVAPDLVFTHRRDDAHQDHREVSALTWNAFRDQLILEYEIPKWDGDLGRPNVYVPVTRAHLERKIELLLRHFGSQRSKDWFDAETFRGLARLRGMEARAPDGYAEAFWARKVVLGVGPERTLA